MALAPGALSACALPPPVADRIGRAQIFVFAMKDRGVLSGRRDVVWGDKGPPLPGVYSLHYMSGDRDTNPAHDSAWYGARHPDWMLRLCGDHSPTKEFSANYVAVDLSNRAVREHILEDALATGAIAAGPAVAVDNIADVNSFASCGIQAADGWRPLFSGRVRDPAFASNVADWVGWLHDQFAQRGLCMMVNHYYTGDRAAYLAIDAHTDMDLDEGGFTRGCKPLAVGDAWWDRTRLLTDVAKRKPLIVVDQICPDPKAITPALLDWSIANYLLIKGDRTYLALTEHYGDLVDFPELYLRTGRPRTGIVRQQGGAVTREFERALAVVNPSQTAPARLRLPSGAGWRDHRGGPPVALLTVAPGGARVLVR
jgi:hypothetical protein